MNILTALYAGSLAVISGGDTMRGAELDPFFIFAIAAVLLLGEGIFSNSKSKNSDRSSRGFETNE
jgi:hypothetical protein